MALSHDAIVLGGGTGRRLGGASKPDILLHGRRLLDHVLAATTGAGRIVVVAPDTVPVPDGVLRTLEDPPHGGPVAGIAAGLAALDRAAGAPGADRSAPLTLVLACDVPGAAGAVPGLLAEAVRREAAGAGPGSSPTDGTGAADNSTAAGNPAVGDNSADTGEGGEVREDGVVVRDAGGRDQWLVGVYRTDRLRERLAELAATGGARGCPVREMVRPLRLARVLADGRDVVDIDTWDDLERVANDRDNK